MRALEIFSVVASACAISFVIACGSQDPYTPPPPDAGAIDGGIADSGVPPDPRFRTVLETPADLAAISSTIAGASVKYLAPVEGRAAFPPLTEHCYFQNMRLFPWHLQFLQSFEEHQALTYDAYLSIVLSPSSRQFWGGGISAHAGARHPLTQAQGVVAYEIYTLTGTLQKEDVIAVDRRMKECIPFARDLLVFYPSSPDQIAFVMRERAALAAEGVGALFQHELEAPIPFAPYSRGENYGTLEIVPQGQPLDTYGPRDVVIAESAPNDISIVSGMITKYPQNPLGHVNLRLREKGIPNASVSGIYDAAWIRALDKSLVHVIVTDEQFMLEPARLEDAEAFWEAHRIHVPPPQADLTVKDIVSFETLRASDRLAFGVKAANLGEIHSVLGAANRNDGFGIPLSAYDDFIHQNNLQAEVERISTDPQMKTDSAYKKAQLKALRDMIKAGTIDPVFFSGLQAKIEQVFGASSHTTRIKFRSSTNVEDLAQLTGAGLYESKAGCLADDLDADIDGPSLCLSERERASLQSQLDARQAEFLAHPERAYLGAIISDLQGDLQEEKEIHRAVKKVWASLWNERAYDEREYYGIDHRAAFMAIAVNPSFVLERANAVIVSNLHVDGGAPLYRVNSQLGTESVVQPEDPMSVAELLTFRRENDEPTNVLFELGSSLLAPGEHVWPDDKLIELAHLVFTLHDHFATVVYPDISPLSLDYEAKYSDDGSVVIKQVRPYVSFDP